MARLFQFKGRVCLSIQLFFPSTTPLNSAWAVGIQLCAFRFSQHHWELRLQKHFWLHLLLCPWPLVWVCSGPSSQLTSLGEVMWVIRGFGAKIALPRKMEVKESSCSISAAGIKRRKKKWNLVKHCHCQQKEWVMNMLRALTPYTILTVALGEAFWTVSKKQPSSKNWSTEETQ